MPPVRESPALERWEVRSGLVGVLTLLLLGRNDLLRNSRVVTVSLRHDGSAMPSAVIRVRVNQFGHVPAVLIDPIDRKGRVVQGMWLGADLDDRADGTAYIKVRSGKWRPNAGSVAPKLSHVISRCKTCGREATCRRNPFFGHGLSVHEFIAECTAYSHVELLGLTINVVEPPAVESRERWTRLRRFLSFGRDEAG